MGPCAGNGQGLVSKKIAVTQNNEIKPLDHYFQRRFGSFNWICHPLPYVFYNSICVRRNRSGASLFMGADGPTHFS